VGLGPPTVVRLEGALAHDCSWRTDERAGTTAIATGEKTSQGTATTGRPRQDPESFASTRQRPPTRRHGNGTGPPSGRSNRCTSHPANAAKPGTVRDVEPLVAWPEPTIQPFPPPGVRCDTPAEPRAQPDDPRLVRPAPSMAAQIAVR
jgi:hypothetical protein